jgi:periplasmic divalent cation tolerance protein
MSTVRQYSLVLVTAPTLKVARALARGALEERFVACANLIPRIESHYWWQGKITSGREVLLLLKTMPGKLSALENFISTHHPYDTPEFVVLPFTRGSERYLTWLKASLTA